MDRLIKIESRSAIPSIYSESPIGLLLEYHNLGRKFENYSSARLLVGMCMDNRKHLNIPDNFAFIIRTGGANLRHSEFKVSFAIAVGGVKHIVLIGHNNCGMVNLVSKKNIFIEGLVKNAGWTKQQAEEQFISYAPLFEIGNEIDFVLSETVRLRGKYPKIQIAPMIYLVEDNRLYLIKE
ncbi:MAG: carbonic anhydrase [Chlorobi bacterium]|nr:carbonic anhydrase [Chlorobiota bacterium]MCI0716991.1 carbonic anhydrase [Chlorobiota bacterium]